MHAKKTIQHRFTGGRHENETGTIRKKWRNRLPIGLLFANRYEVGMSNLGFQQLYSLLNSEESIVAERFFQPARDGVLRSEESQRPLTDFPIIFCSISFESDYFNLVQILHQVGIEPLAVRREGSRPVTAGQPLVVAGGVATFMNPEPLAPYVDLFYIGEAEPVIPDFLSWLIDNWQMVDRSALLKKIVDTFRGMYAPLFYTPVYSPENRLVKVDVADNFPFPVERVTLETPTVAGHSTLTSPEAEFSNLHLTELGRGCSRGCRFCAAGFIYRPPRLWSPESIIKGIAMRTEECSRIGLLGMEMARQEDLAALSNYLVDNNCSLSFSSLRADAISPELLKLLASSNLKSAAIAPDGGSERLRRVINKGLTEEDLLAAAELLVKAGIANLKLYFMIGLPTETDEDIKELVRLTLTIKKKILAHGRSRGRLSNLTLSINCFIPKPWTPFQFHPFASIAALKSKIKFIRKELSHQPNLKINTERPEKSMIQALLARGDRRIGAVLLPAVISQKNIRQVFRHHDINAEEEVSRERTIEELFPWEIIDNRIAKKYLWHEYQKALRAETTVPCDTARCRRCGVCTGE
jgi:radical SAM superfamily enzyme YgiQ (UPF0313 family)